MTDPKPIRRVVLDLPQIAARCVEEGDCLIWTQGCSGAGYPFAWHAGASRNVRRLVLTLTTGEALPSRMRVITTCGHALCLNPNHLRALIPTEAAKVYASRGAYTWPHASAAKTAGKRRVSKIMTLEMARAIRSADVASAQDLRDLAERHGVKLSMVRSIRTGRTWRETVSLSSIFGMGVAA